MELKVIGLLAAKIESSYGTDPVPTAASNSLPVVGDTLSYSIGSTAVPRVALDGQMGRQAGFNSLRMITLKFSYELRGNRTDGVTADISAGAIGNKVELDALLRACNMAATYTAETVNGARDGYVTYTPTTPSGVGDSVAFYFWTKSKLHKVLGAKGTFTVTVEAGKMPIIEFEFKGFYITPTDATFPTNAAFLDTKPPLVENMGLVFDADSGLVVQKAVFTKGNNVAMRPDANSAKGYAGFIITDFDSKGTIDPEAGTEASHPYFADWESSKIKSLDIGYIGSDSGNKIGISVLAEQKNINYADRNGVRIHNVEFDIVRSGLGQLPEGMFVLTFL